MNVTTASYTCPVCHKTSFNHNDALHQFCGNCHAFTGIGPTHECVPIWNYEFGIRMNWLMTISLGMSAAVLAIALTRLVHIFWPVHGTRNFLIGATIAMFVFTVVNYLSARAKLRKSQREYDETKAKYRTAMKGAFNEMQKSVAETTMEYKEARKRHLL